MLDMMLLTVYKCHVSRILKKHTIAHTTNTHAMCKQFNFIITVYLGTKKLIKIKLKVIFFKADRGPGTLQLR